MGIRDRGTLTQEGRNLAAVPSGSVVLLRDRQFGADVRHLFMGLIQITSQPGLQLNGLPIERYQRDDLREAVAYVDPSREFFEGTLLENITSFQPRRYQRKALFWSYLTGLDTTVRGLPQGYATAMGTSVPTGLSRDAQPLFQVVTALPPPLKALLLDLPDASSGKESIDGHERILRRTLSQFPALYSRPGRGLNKTSHPPHQQTAPNAAVLAC